MSDHGFVIISMFFDLPIDGSLTVTNPATDFQMQPGRVSDYNGVQVQHEREYAGWCEDRANNGYNSGMVRMPIINEAPRRRCCGS